MPSRATVFKTAALPLCDFSAFYGELKIYRNFVFISNIKKRVEFENSTLFLKNLSNNYSAFICPFDKRRLMFEVKALVLS